MRLLRYPALSRSPRLTRGVAFSSASSSWSAEPRGPRSQLLVNIVNGTFYREHPASHSSPTSNPAYFAGLNFALEAASVQDVGTRGSDGRHFAVVGANDTTTFLEVIRGSLLCVPPTARTYPYLSSAELDKEDTRLRIPSRAIQYVGFNAKAGGGIGSGAGGVQGAYLSARYESRREETDWTVLQYLKGDTELNPSEDLHQILKDDNALLLQTIKDLKLEKLISMPVSNLSNGQTRRARIAKALLSRPKLLLLDEPFMGLDPPTLVTLSPMLRDLAYRASPLLMLGLRPQDPIPDWITDIIVLGNERNVAAMGDKDQTIRNIRVWREQRTTGGNSEEGPDTNNMSTKLREELPEVGADVLWQGGIQPYKNYERKKQELVSDKTTSKRSSITVKKQSDTETASNSQTQITGEALIELQDLVLKYGTKTVLGHPPPQAGYDMPGLNLTIRRSTRLALLGPNGSGKTTLLSLLTSDHPQSYSLPIKFFGRNRLPEPGKPGLSLWEIQKRIGHSSPEVHAFFPKHMSVRKVLESAWAETFSSKPELNDARNKTVDRVLRWFEPELKQVRGHFNEEASSSNQEMRTYPFDPESSTVWSTDRSTHAFSFLSFGTQRLLLLLRALVAQPDIIVLDEAFSGLPTSTRDKAMLFLEKGESVFLHHGQETKNSGFNPEVMLPGLTDQQALIVVSHVREEIPPSVKEWVRLPSEEEATESGKGVEMGRVEGEGIRGPEGWNSVWGLGHSRS